MAAERAERNLVGIDIWDNAKEVILSRMEHEKLAIVDMKKWDMFSKEIHFIGQAPDRADNGDEAAPFLRVNVRFQEPTEPRTSQAEMYEHLPEKY